MLHLIFTRLSLSQNHNGIWKDAYSSPKGKMAKNAKQIGFPVRAAHLAAQAAREYHLSRQHLPCCAPDEPGIGPGEQKTWL